MLKKQNKVILVDWGVFAFRAIYAWRKNRAVPSTYTAMNMLISCLSRVGVDKDDTVIIAVDGKNSWRKDRDSNYKANRAELREKATDIDWAEHFNNFTNLLENIEYNTPFWVIQIAKLEADDIIAEAVRYFKDKECVIISCDADYEQLTAYNWVKLFSDRSKKYKLIKNPYKILASKIRKEASDNLTEEITNEEEYKIREEIVSLLKLPEFVEKAVKFELDQIDGEKKELNLEGIKFDGIRRRFMNVYRTDMIVTMEDSLKKVTKRKKKRTEKITEEV